MCGSLFETDKQHLQPDRDPLRFVSVLSGRRNRANRESVGGLASAALSYLDDGSLQTRGGNEVLNDLGSTDFPALLSRSLGVRTGTVRDRMRDIQIGYSETLGFEVSRAHALLLLLVEMSMAPMMHGYLESARSARAPLMAELSALSHMLGKWGTEHSNLRICVAECIITDGAGNVVAGVPAVSRFLSEVVEPVGVSTSEIEQLSAAVLSGLQLVAVRRTALLEVGAAVLAKAEELELIGTPSEELAHLFVEERGFNQIAPPVGLLPSALSLAHGFEPSGDDWISIVARAAR